jgi:hypothetical protein
MRAGPGSYILFRVSLQNILLKKNLLSLINLL